MGGSNVHGESTAPEGTFGMVSASLRSHSCGVLDTGDVKCWGSNAFKQCDAPDGKFKQVTTGERFSCAIEQHTGVLQCWGSIPNGVATAMVSGPFDEVTASSKHVCTVANGKPECWGTDILGSSRIPDHIAEVI